MMIPNLLVSLTQHHISIIIDRVKCLPPFWECIKHLAWQIIASVWRISNLMVAFNYTILYCIDKQCERKKGKQKVLYAHT